MATSLAYGLCLRKTRDGKKYSIKPFQVLCKLSIKGKLNRSSYRNLKLQTKKPYYFIYKDKILFGMSYSDIYLLLFVLL